MQLHNVSQNVQLSLDSWTETNHESQSYRISENDIINALNEEEKLLK